MESAVCENENRGRRGATKAAVEEGIVAGGGTALLKVNALSSQKHLPTGKIKAPKEFTKEYEVGFEILLRP